MFLIDVPQKLSRDSVKSKRQASSTNYDKSGFTNYVKNEKMLRSVISDTLFTLFNKKKSNKVA